LHEEIQNGALHKKYNMGKQHKSQGFIVAMQHYWAKVASI